MSAKEGENQCLSSWEQHKTYLEACFPAGKAPPSQSRVVNTTEKSGRNIGLERRREDMVSKVSSLY